MRRAVTFALLALLLPPLAVAAPPRDPAWGSEIAQGPAVALGFLDAGFIVLATGDAALVPGLPGATCAAENEDADLFLFTFPDGDGCVQALDTSGTLGQEGVTALAAASARNRVTIGLPTSSASGEASNVAVYDLDGSELTRSHVARAAGRVTRIATDPEGFRTAVASVDTSGSATSHRLSMYEPSGVRVSSFTTPGPVLGLTVSPNGRFVAAGGNFSQEGSEFGWARLYDLSLAAALNPVLDERVLEAGAGVVTAAVATNEGLLFAGTAAGRALHLRKDARAFDVEIGDGETLLATNADGSVIVAAAGTAVARIGGLPDSLDELWVASIAEPARHLALRGDYVFAGSGALSAFDTDGHLLWERDGGIIFGAASDGLGVAVASTTAGTPTTPALATLSAGVLDANLTVTQVGAAPTVSPGDIGVLDLKVKNVGAAIVNATLDLDLPGGVVGELIPAYLVLRPDEEGDVAVHATVSGGALPGEQRIAFTAITDPESNLTGNLTIRIGETTRVALELQAGTLASHSVVQGQNVSLAFALRNSGNTDATARIEVLQFPSRGGSWAFAVEPASRVTVQRDSVTTVVVDVEVPAAAADGTRNRFVVRAVVGTGASAAAVDFLVNPFEALDITPRLRTELLAPGSASTLAYTVKNLGSIASNVTFLATALDEDGAAIVPSDWVVDVDRREAQLAAGAEVAVNVLVSAPPAGKTGDTLRIQLLARTQDAATAGAIGFAHVDESLKADAPEEPRREPIALIVPLAALAAAALLMRGRDDDGKP